MKRQDQVFFGVVLCGLIAAALVHLASYVSVQDARFSIASFLLSVTSLAAFAVGVYSFCRARRARTSMPVAHQRPKIPKWLAIAVLVLVVYVPINSLTSGILLKRGGIPVHGAQLPSLKLSTGKVIAVSTATFDRQVRYEERMSTAHSMIFFAAALLCYQAHWNAGYARDASEQPLQPWI